MTPCSAPSTKTPVIQPTRRWSPMVELEQLKVNKKARCPYASLLYCSVYMVDKTENMSEQIDSQHSKRAVQVNDAQLHDCTRSLECWKDRKCYLWESLVP